MNNRIRQLVLGAALAAMVMVGGAALHPTSTFAKPNIHCHTLNRIDYWVMTGIESDQDQNIYCHGSM